MTPAQITADVDRGLEIQAQLALLKTEAKAIADRLESAALEGEQIPLEDATRAGRQYLALGSAALVPVVLESDIILGTFPPESAAHLALAAAAGGQLPLLYKEVVKFERVPRDGHAYRAACFDLLGPAAGARAIAAALARDAKGTPKSRVVIDWDRAKPLHPDTPDPQP